MFLYVSLLSYLYIFIVLLLINFRTIYTRPVFCELVYTVLVMLVLLALTLDLEQPVQ